MLPALENCLSVEEVKTEAALTSHGSDVLRRCNTDTFGPLKHINNGNLFIDL